MIKRILVTLVIVVSCISQINAQNATPLSSLVFDQIAPDLNTANSYIYKYYPDESTTGMNLTVNCTGTASPFTCTSPMPAFTPGMHSLTITAANVAGESPKSSPINFTFVIIPSSPTNLRIQ
jgi:hypothetical protein